MGEIKKLRIGRNVREVQINGFTVLTRLSDRWCLAPEWLRIALGRNSARLEVTAGEFSSRKAVKLPHVFESCEVGC